MQDQEATAVAEMGIASESHWVLPSGLGSFDLSPEAAQLPESVGSISYHQFSLRPGLEVYKYAATIRSPVTMRYSVLTGQPYLWLAVNSRGNSGYRHGDSLHDGVVPNMMYCALLRESVSHLDYPPSYHQTAGMAVSPERLRDMLQGQRLWGPIDEFLDGRFDPRVMASRPTTAQSLIAEQIDRHPYHGAMAAVFLEAKAFELLAETLRTLIDNDGSSHSWRGRRQALAARDIMMADPANPPRIEDVARQVGLSQRRLNDVFREVFGAPPLQCLVQWRLDLGRQLLAGGEASVKEVAGRLGYAHASNFSLAFTRRFGHPPTGISGVVSFHDDESA